MGVRGRVGRAGALGALVVTLAGVAAACADGEPIVARSPERVAVTALAGDPATYERRSVIVRGTTARDIDDPPGAVVLETGDLLVIAPMKPDDVPEGTDVQVAGTVRAFDYQDPGALDLDEVGEPLAAFDGEYAVFATDFEVLAPSGTDPSGVPAEGTGD